MSPSTSKSSLAIAAAAIMAIAVPSVAAAHGTCKPVKAAHKIVHRTAPKPVKAVRVRAAVAPCNCATRTTVRYVPAPPPVVRRVVVYRRPAEPVFVHAPYVDETPVVYDRYAARRTYIRHEYHRHYAHRGYARRDVAFGDHWRHYNWGDDRPY